MPMQSVISARGVRTGTSKKQSELELKVERELDSARSKRSKRLQKTGQCCGSKTENRIDLCFVRPIEEIERLCDNVQLGGLSERKIL